MYDSLSNRDKADRDRRSKIQIKINQALEDGNLPRVLQLISSTLDENSIHQLFILENVCHRFPDFFPPVYDLLSGALYREYQKNIYEKEYILYNLSDLGSQFLKDHKLDETNERETIIRAQIGDTRKKKSRYKDHLERKRFPNVIEKKIFEELDYKDLFGIINELEDYHALEKDVFFWANKAFREFETSISEFRKESSASLEVREYVPKEILDPRERYIEILTQKGEITYGSERFIKSSAVMEHALENDDPDFVDYLISQGISPFPSNQFDIRSSIIGKQTRKGKFETVRYFIEMEQKGRSRDLTISEAIRCALPDQIETVIKLFSLYDDVDLIQISMIFRNVNLMFLNILYDGLKKDLNRIFNKGDLHVKKYLLELFDSVGMEDPFQKDIFI